ncbi:MAG: hypothetical protein PHX84_03310 [Candidatus Shapirobacteria bacterium]|nr:hypothetical protein [Candidatus Shapirobacteria bacterium]
MEKFFRKTKIFFSLLTVLMLGIFVGLGESFYLSKMGNKKVLGAVDDNSINLMITSDFQKEREINIVESVSGDDARPLIIKKYLEKYKSPLIPYSDLIFKLSQDYGFEYYWIVAIAQQESNLCKKIPEGSHNCWGYGIHKRGTLTFDSYELSLKSYAEYLKREYFDKGLNTPELIMSKYCPSSNGSWARGVNQFIKEMEEGKF